MRCEKIVIVTTSFPQNDNSHSGIFVKRLADALNIIRSEKIEVIVPADGEKAALSVPYEVFRVRYIPSKLQKKLHGKGGLPAAIKGNKWLLFLVPLLAIGLFWSVYRRSNRSTAILANWTLAGFICCLAGIIRRSPVVTILRGSDVNSTKDSWAALALLWVTLRLSRKVVCVSDDLKNNVLKIAPNAESKLEVIGNGIDMPVSNQKDIETGKELSLLFVGNTTQNKNLSLILEALSELKKKNVKFRLDVIGDGPETKKLKGKVADLQLFSVSFHGAVAPGRVAQFMNNSLVFINASFSEGRSNSLLEAICCGCIAVVSDIPSNRAIIEHRYSGLLFDPHNPSSLASQLLWVEENRALANSMAVKGREVLSQSSYSWRDCAQKYSMILNKL